MFKRPAMPTSASNGAGSSNAGGEGGGNVVQPQLIQPHHQRRGSDHSSIIGKIKSVKRFIFNTIKTIDINFYFLRTE
jgi:hypothetical protein